MAQEILPLAQQVEAPLPGLWSWCGYSTLHKFVLTSHAVETQGGIVVIDPIPLTQIASVPFNYRLDVQAIVITNVNHYRATDDWNKLGKIYTHSDDLVSDGRVKRIPLVPNDFFGLQAHPLVGGAQGEVALFDESKKLMIMGDGLINSLERGLELLPSKYCQNQVLLKNNLKPLLILNFDNMVFAHGNAIVGGAKERLRDLLKGD